MRERGESRRSEVVVCVVVVIDKEVEVVLGGRADGDGRVREMQVSAVVDDQGWMRPSVALQRSVTSE